MTDPGYIPGRHALGIADAAKRRVAAQLGSDQPRATFTPPPRRALTNEERKAAAQAAAQPGAVCRLCGCLHGAEEAGCPRLASFELDNDGRVKAGTFWPPGTWEDPERIIWADDAYELPSAPEAPAQ